MTNGASPPGWYHDPTGQGDGRYWNGASWTEAVDRGGVTVNVPIDPNQASVPPLPGTQVAIPAPPPVASNERARTSSRSPIGIIVGLLVAVLVVVLVVVLVSDGSSEAPPPGSDAPATGAPATDPASDGG